LVRHSSSQASGEAHRRKHRDPHHPAFVTKTLGFATGLNPTYALTKLGLRQLKWPCLVGLVAVDNAASRRVLETSNFTLERSTIHHGEKVAMYRSPRLPSMATDGGMAF
jgi:hypothetical protein